MKKAFNKVAAELRELKQEGPLPQTLLKIGIETLNDLRRPKEIFALVAAVVTPIPGFSLTYVGYRFFRHRQLREAQNNNEPQKPDAKPDAKAAPGPR